MRIMLLILLLACSVSAQTGLYNADLVPFDTLMTGIMDRYNIPGGVLAVSKDSRLVYCRGFGYSDTTNQVDVDPSNYFRIASVSKTITAMAVMKLIEDDVIEFSTLVFDYLDLTPVAGDTLIDGADVITVQMLLEHRSGWNAEYVFLSRTIATHMGVSSPPSATDCVRYYMCNVALTYTPNTVYSYANVNYLILGRVIEKATGLTYEAYVKSLMKDIQVGNIVIGDSRTTVENEVLYYDEIGAPMYNSVWPPYGNCYRPYGYWDQENIDACGGWISNASEMCKMIISSIDTLGSRPRILSNATIKTQLTSDYITGAVYKVKGWSKDTVNAVIRQTGSLYGTWSLAYWGPGDVTATFIVNYRDTGLGSWAFPIINGVRINAALITDWPTYDLFSPLLSVPTDSAVIYPIYNFSWGAVAGADYYHLEISIDEDFSNCIVNDSTLTVLSKKVVLPPSTTYWWRVRSIMDYYSLEWSLPRTFTTLGIDCGE